MDSSRVHNIGRRYNLMSANYSALLSRIQAGAHIEFEPDLPNKEASRIAPRI